MKKPDPINKVKNQDEFSSGLMESYGKWMAGDCFQNTQMPDLHLSEAPFDGMDPQSNGAEIEQTSIKKKEAKKPSAKAQLAANEEVLEREEYEVDGETYVIEKKKGLDGKACWKGYKLAGTKKKGGKTVDNCVKAGDEGYIHRIGGNYAIVISEEGNMFREWIKNIRSINNTRRTSL